MCVERNSKTNNRLISRCVWSWNSSNVCATEIVAGEPFLIFNEFSTSLHFHHGRERHKCRGSSYFLLCTAFIRHCNLISSSSWWIFRICISFFFLLVWFRSSRVALQSINIANLQWVLHAIKISQPRSLWRGSLATNPTPIRCCFPIDMLSLE